MERTQWEYIGLQAQANSLQGFIEMMNDAGARSWELVSLTNNDRIGLSSVVAIMRRPVEPLPDPDDTDADWKPDPAGRFSSRYWDGESWTMRTMTDGIEHRDPPTSRTPAQVRQ